MAEWLVVKAIKSWHGGKIGLLWLLSFAVPVVFGDGNPFFSILYWFIWGAPWVIPITWQWLSGKEKR